MNAKKYLSLLGMVAVMLFSGMYAYKTFISGEPRWYFLFLSFAIALYLLYSIIEMRRQKKRGENDRIDMSNIQYIFHIVKAPWLVSKQFVHTFAWPHLWLHITQNVVWEGSIPLWRRSSSYISGTRPAFVNVVNIAKCL